MEIPRGHAAVPLNESDFLDFIFTYFKAEYAPIRSFWSTATADPRQMSRWFNMGHELAPLRIRPANAQAQKDLESVDYFTRKWNLDADFVRGLVIRYAKYEVHDRLEKKLYESARLDLMVRKALKEKHLIDALWPSPAPRNLAQELLSQGVQVRKWYGDMFNKYFRVLHSVDQFELRPEVDHHIKHSGTLMLVPFVDHLLFGSVDPIMPIVAKGAGYSNANGWRASGTKKNDAFGEPGRFEIRFDAPEDATDTYTKTVVRQCQCNKCGMKKDVHVVISIDPNPVGSVVAGTSSRRKASALSARPRDTSKTAQRYAPGYSMPSKESVAPIKPPRPQVPVEEPPRAGSPEQKKQCPRCTFLNHPELTACEMCQADLPSVTISKPPSPAAARVSHSHSASTPSTTTAEASRSEAERPPGLSRQSLSSTLFSIFPFSQQQQQEHHAQLPPTQDTSTSTPSQPPRQRVSKEDARRPAKQQPEQPVPRPSSPSKDESSPPTKPFTPPNATTSYSDQPETALSNRPEMAMMPLTPSAESSSNGRAAPAGLPSNLMDNFVPVSPAFPRDQDNEDAGWGEMSKAEATGDNDEEEEQYEVRTSGGMVDLDAVAREEADVWGDREE